MQTETTGGSATKLRTGSVNCNSTGNIIVFTAAANCKRALVRFFVVSTGGAGVGINSLVLFQNGVSTGITLSATTPGLFFSQIYGDIPNGTNGGFVNSNYWPIMDIVCGPGDTLGFSISITYTAVIGFSAQEEF